VRPAQHLADAIDPDDVGMLEPRDRAGLDQEPLTRGHLGVRGGQELERDRPLEHVVVPEVHGAHSATPELANHAKPIELRGWHPAMVRGIVYLVAGHRLKTTMYAGARDLHGNNRNTPRWQVGTRICHRPGGAGRPRSVWYVLARTGSGGVTAFLNFRDHP